MHLWKATVLVVGVGAIGVVACGGGSDATPAAAGDGGVNASSSSGGTSGSTPPEPVVVDVAEKEPNNEPTSPQDLGTLSAATTLRVKGKNDTGGNDGANYTGDVDTFAVTFGTAGGAVSLEVDWTGDADVDAVVVDPKFSVTNGEDAAKPIVMAASAQAGKYIIAVRSKDLPADYTMTIKYTLPVAGGGGTGGSCVSTLQESPGGGCSFTMNEPANGEALTLPYRFGWRSDGCETPGKIFYYGNPPTEDNWISFQYVRGGQTSLLNVTGTHDLTAAEVAELRSDNGTYHWQMESFHKARSPGRTFTIAPGVCK